MSAKKFVLKRRCLVGGYCFAWPVGGFSGPPTSRNKGAMDKWEEENHQWRKNETNKEKDKKHHGRLKPEDNQIEESDNDRNYNSQKEKSLNHYKSKAYNPSSLSDAYSNLLLLSYANPRTSTSLQVIPNPLPEVRKRPPT